MGTGPYGISPRMLVFQATVLTCRVLSFPLLQYVPQGIDLFPLIGDVTSLMLIVLIFIPTVHADVECADVFRTREVLIISAVAAANYQLHSTGVRNVDIAWSAAVYIDMFAMLPQLWMISRSGGETEATVGHHIASVFAARLVLATFWWRKCLRVNGTRTPVWILLVACAFQVVMLLRFMGFYVRAGLAHGFVDGVALVCMDDTEQPQPKPQTDSQPQQCQ
eukprot:NODE_12136_length_1243_cov_9.621864.p1 GENE.NODE_12136_length_1243_cov_9.621864~~NODE_12136_length_1243_cov_9.621864.p1  ORF type:complete len:221 (+),score=56.24 NODE_12136_length_1243_cov_9.621864:247-909(+)